MCSLQVTYFADSNLVLVNETMAARDPLSVIRTLSHARRGRVANVVVAGHPHAPLRTDSTLCPCLRTGTFGSTEGLQTTVSPRSSALREGAFLLPKEGGYAMIWLPEATCTA